MIIIQSTSVRWTKESRGMPFAEKRNSVPTKHIIPMNDCKNDIIIHEVGSDEEEDFVLKNKIIQSSNMSKYKNFEFLVIDDLLNVSFKYNSLRVRPKRGKHKQNIFKLKSCEVGEFIINYRFGIKDWSYCLQNVKFYYDSCSEYDPELFVKILPAKIVDKTENLF